MLVQKKISNIRKNVLIAVLVLVLLIIAYLVYTNFVSDMLFPTSSNQMVTANGVVPLVEPSFDNSFVTDFLVKPPFTNLVSSSSLSVSLSQAGRANPFDPINYGGEVTPK